MNIALFRLRPLLKELHGIRLALEHANEIRELELAYNGLHIKPPIADTSGPEPETTYTNEEADFFRELSEELGKVGRKRKSDEVTATATAMSDITGKTRAFIFVTIGIVMVAWTTTKTGTSPEVQISALRWVGTAGLFVLGGQTLVDSVANVVVTLAALKDKAAAVIKEKTEAK